MNKYINEKNKLLFGIDEGLEKVFKKAGCFIVGGALTSVFSNKEINDLDIYFRDFDSLKYVLKNLFNVNEDDEDEIIPEKFIQNEDVGAFSLVHKSHTDKSILFCKDELKVQLIYFKFFNNIEEIFKTFDFTINMAAYDFAEDKFHFHDDFLKDVAQRTLRVNPDTSFPIVSLLRVDKYRQRGYSISRKDFVNLCLSVNRLKINSWEELSSAVGGMYGYIYTDLFDIKKEFSIDEAINQLSLITSKLENYTIGTVQTDYSTLIDKIIKNLKIVLPEPVKIKIFYKKVLRTEIPNEFVSYSRREFKYKIGEVVNGGLSGIWTYKNPLKAKSHWATSNKENEAYISLKASDDAEIRKDGSGVFRIIGDATVLEEIIQKEEKVIAPEPVNDVPF